LLLGGRCFGLLKRLEEALHGIVILLEQRNGMILRPQPIEHLTRSLRRRLALEMVREHRDQKNNRDRHAQHIKQN
jgi:hypothetical protein